MELHNYPSLLVSSKWSAKSLGTAINYIITFTWILSIVFQCYFLEFTSLQQTTRRWADLGNVLPKTLKKKKKQEECICYVIMNVTVTWGASTISSITLLTYLKGRFHSCLCSKAPSDWLRRLCNWFSRLFEWLEMFWSVVGQTKPNKQSCLLLF